MTMEHPLKVENYPARRQQSGTEASQDNQSGIGAFLGNQRRTTVLIMTLGKSDLNFLFGTCLRNRRKWFYWLFSRDENEIPTGREIQNTPPSERNSRRFFKDVEDPKNEDQDRKSTSGSQSTSTADSSSSTRWGGKPDKKDYESSSLPDSVQGSGKYSR